VTHSKHTNKIRLSSQHSSRQGAKITHVQWHHTASVSGRGDGIVTMMVTGSRTVSSNYVIGSDGYIWLVVDEVLRAWTSGSTKDGGKGAAWDRKSLTHECCNSTGAPSWLQSEKFYQSAAKLALDYYQRYGIPLDRDHHLGHRELYIRFGASYPTACPGGMDIDKILRMAKSLLNPAATEQEKAATRAVGAYLNSLNLGRTSTAATTGIEQDPSATKSDYFWLVQTWAKKYRPDLYGSGYVVDGIVGPGTRGVLAVLRPMVLAGEAPDQILPPPPVVKEGDSVNLTKVTPVFPSSAKAKRGEGSTASYQPGSYSVYKVYGEAINISKTPGKPGGWVMASTLKVATDEWLVVYDLNDNSEILSAVEVMDGTVIERPADPVRSGYEFLGWFDGASDFTKLYEFDSKVEGNLDLRAEWKQIVEHSVTFDDGHGTQLRTVVRDGQPVPTPGEPMPNVGEVFLGWFLGEEPYDFSAPVTGDLVITAVYEEETVDTPDPEPEPEEPTKPTRPSVPWSGLIGAGIATAIGVLLWVLFGIEM